MNRDLAFGCAAFALAVGYYLMAATIPATLLADTVGPQGLPKTYTVLLGGLSLILIIRSLPSRPFVRSVRLQPDAGRRRAGQPDSGRTVRLQPDSGRTVRLQPDSGRPVRLKPDTTVSPQALGRVAGLLAIGVAYVVVVPWLGYMLSLAALIMATTYYQGGALDRRVIVVAMSGAIVFWLLFVKLLGIPQPAGLWPSLL